MKIGILTQPIQVNYGGVIQAYALRTFLQSMGHDVVIIDRIWNNSKGKRFLQKGKYFSLKLAHKILGKGELTYFPTLTVYDVRKTYGAEILKFSKRYLGIDDNCFTTSKQLLNYVIQQNFEAIIVGSDQVWRPCYSPCIYDYFLGFLPNDYQLKRIAYAASFGVDNWEYSFEETQKCRDLIRLFNAVSVREISAIDLCKQYFQKDASYVLDPTLLLKCEDYISLINEVKEKKCGDGIFYYILDTSDDKKAMLNEISKMLNMNSFTIGPEDRVITPEKLKYALNKLMIPSVTKWLRAFMDAKLVITDSFHGCVFSIIFNKPFWVILNQERGKARFESLLSLFHLENRIINCVDSNIISKNISINWTEVNRIWSEERKKSIDFITKNL